MDVFVRMLFARSAGFRYPVQSPESGAWKSLSLWSAEAMTSAIYQLRRRLTELKSGGSYYLDGKRCFLCLDDAQFLVSKLERRNQGARRHKLRPKDEACWPCRRVHAFWSSSTLSGHSALPLECAAGLASARQIGLEVFLWTYDDEVVQVPQGVTVKNADSLFPIAEARHWLDGGIAIQHLADLVRLQAAKLHPGSAGEPRIRRAWRFPTALQNGKHMTAFF